LAAAFHLPTWVFEALALALVKGSVTDSSPGGQAEIRMAGIGTLPSKMRMGEMKISMAYIQMNKI
jgi:hypothetical protein